MAAIHLLDGLPVFQAMFAATAATIVSGAVAERIKINAYLDIYSNIRGSCCIPSLEAGNGEQDGLTQWDSNDFAGSTLVHSVGGWGALSWYTMIIGPRLGKYVEWQSS